jgi:asparagine synthase (glutamine-hydrolysing)
MCGLAGQVNWQGAVDMPALERMVHGIAHRGPDDQGLWRDADGVCALGFRRLSIIDLSPGGHQPMIDPSTGNALVFNGEIYNYKELRRDCEARGDTFASSSDTEVILALYRRHGPECLQLMRGMFAIALWDAGLKRLFLARDRVGKKPLNYALTSEGIVFASEIAPLARHPAVSSTTDFEALELYLQLQSIPAPWTIYRDIRKLPPAHYLLVDQHSCSIVCYWNVDYRRKSLFTEEQALEAFEEKLTEAVRLRMISDVPLGALLSGGVDSSVIVALMSKLSGDPVRTFSIGFSEERFNELAYAQSAADRCGTLHHPEIVAGEVGHLLPLIARHYGEPYGDSSAVPSFFVSRVARRHVTVVLNGDGGDELLGGYERYCVRDWAIASGGSMSAFIGPQRLARMVPYLSRSRSTIARAFRKLMREAVSPELGSLMMFQSFWNDHERRGLLNGSGAPWAVPQWRERWWTEAFEQAANPIDRMLWQDNRTYLSDTLLVKMDIASMHCGLEARSPLLDQEVIEFCAGLPVDLKVNGRVGKYLLKKLAERYYPPDFVHRKKMGFGIPVAQWLRGPLRGLVESTILDPALMDPLSQPTIRECWQALLRGEAPVDANASRIWTLLMYGQWRQSAAA